jgi:hypothetical protein
VLTICAVADCLHYWFFGDFEFDIAAETGAFIHHLEQLTFRGCLVKYGGSCVQLMLGWRLASYCGCRGLYMMRGGGIYGKAVRDDLEFAAKA